MIAMARAHVLRGQESGSLAQVASRSSPNSGCRGGCFHEGPVTPPSRLADIPTPAISLPPAEAAARGLWLERQLSSARPARPVARGAAALLAPRYVKDDDSGKAACDVGQQRVQRRR
jgi:hypothetical protein